MRSVSILFVPVVVAVETLIFRPPGQCEYNSCLPVSTLHCSQHLSGVYLFERACPSGQYCTNCQSGRTSLDPITCYCEAPPFMRVVAYGEACDTSKVCTYGECYRPCNTYLHMTLCPMDRCSWSVSSGLCSDKIAKPHAPLWDLLASTRLEVLPESERGDLIVTGTPDSVYPLTFNDLNSAMYMYRLGGEKLLSQAITVERLFLLLDVDTNGSINQTEFTSLPGLLEKLDSSSHKVTQAGRRLTESVTVAQCVGITSSSSSLQTACANANIQGQICYSVSHNIYCPLDKSCKSDCSTCGWQTAVDTKNHKCVPPTSANCKADTSTGLSLTYCPTTFSCVADCSIDCADYPATDAGQGTCRERWWFSTPPTSGWICKYRRKVAQPCFQDIDCIYGSKRCGIEVTDSTTGYTFTSESIFIDKAAEISDISAIQLSAGRSSASATAIRYTGVCLPMPPYNEQYLCDSDYDCPHIGYYCPSDPSNGEDPFYVKFCRLQKGDDEECISDRECRPSSRCNTAEETPKCRALFSLPSGVLAVSELLCLSGYMDVNRRCVAEAAQSLRLGLSCETDFDCPTTDPTGRTAVCECKGWWSEGNGKTCQPIAGDFPGHQVTVRDFYFLKMQECGNFWSEDECVEFGSDILRKIFHAMKCQLQKLSGGPYIPDPLCNLSRKPNAIDYCSLVNA